MDSDKDNANPTILSASDLPSRHAASVSSARADGGTGLFDSLLTKPSWLHELSAASLEPTDTYMDYSSSSASESDPDDNDVREEIDEQEIYDLIKNISDPEHPLSLGSLSVVNLPDISIQGPPHARSRVSTVRVLVTPTITHCSLATVIGLGVRVRLEQALPPRFRVDVRIKDGTHSTADAVSKQLGDKERVAAALENETLMGVIRKMLATA